MPCNHPHLPAPDGSGPLLPRSAGEEIADDLDSALRSGGVSKKMEKPMRITSKGQVTIPVGIREKAGLLPHTPVDFEFDGEVVRIVRAKGGGRRGEWLTRHLRGRGDMTMSTDAIMALTRGE